jgi:hypothetical protein
MRALELREEPKLWEECLDGQQSRVKESACAESIQYAVQEVGLRRCRNILVARYTGDAKGYIDYDYPEFSRS